MFRLPYAPRTPLPVDADKNVLRFLTDEVKHEKIMERLCYITSPEKMAEYESVPQEWFATMLEPADYQALYYLGPNYKGVIRFLDTIYLNGSDFAKSFAVETSKIMRSNKRKFENAMYSVLDSVDERTFIERIAKKRPRGSRYNLTVSMTAENLMNHLPRIDEKYRFQNADTHTWTVIAMYVRMISVRDRVGVFGSPLTRAKYRLLFKGWEKMGKSVFPPFTPEPIF